MPRLVMKLQLHRITFFVENVANATDFYRDTLGLSVAEIRTGWSAFKVSRNVEIAFHAGKGRQPRLEFSTGAELSVAREYFNERGARLGPIKQLAGRKMCAGKDKDGNTISITQN
ncbi:MAG: VOC family protein [Gammaproteobacteria bacterium]|nr:VOC family protein [Gammaproteobacteria bacterium]